MATESKKSSRDIGLEQFVAQTFVAYMKTYAVHWNFEGPNFFSIHKMTEEQYRELAEAVDVLAERLRATGHQAPVSLSQIIEDASMREFKSKASDRTALQELAKTHRQLSTLARESAATAEECQDLFTHDLLVQRSGVHDKFAWMLESVAH